MKTLKIEVYDSPLLGKVIATFKSKKELYAYNEKHSTNADCVAINDTVMLGWDEIELF